MKERGLLFTPENYTKSENGSKTQTRRIVEGKALDIINDLAGSPDPSPLAFQYVKDCERYDDNGDLPYLYTGLLVSLEEYPEEGFIELPCRFGTVGDRLYVKEGLERHSNLIGVRYRRDKAHLASMPHGGYYRWEWKKDYLSPLHMPKWAARLWLELVEVRVERVQDISREDAKAEGLWPGANGLEQAAGRSHGNAQLAFQALWESIHGKGSWDLNPWVWVLSYRKVQP